MAYKIIRPRHGIKSLWDRYKSRIYKLGEMLVESPESGVGSGPVNIKFGDGVTDYEKLPYAVLAPVNEVSEGVSNPPTSDAVKKALENVNVEVVDNLESDSTKLALSANQGRLLNNKISEQDKTIGEVADSLKWTSAGTITGQKSVSLPSNFTELSVICKLSDYYVPFYIPKVNLSSTAKLYVLGWGKSNNTFIGIGVTTSKVSLNMANSDGNSVIASSSMTVYYR